MDTISKFYEAAAPAPKYRMLAQAIRDAIAHNALSAGDRLPPVRDLAWHLGITPGTVARAYTVLTDDKVLTAEVGRGTFVSLPNSAVADDVWNRQVARMTNGLLNLFAPQLPDVGQVALMRTGSPGTRWIIMNTTNETPSMTSSVVSNRRNRKLSIRFWGADLTGFRKPVRSAINDYRSSQVFSKRMALSPRAK